MADYETTGPEIRKLIMKSARSVVNFAFNPGLDVKDSYLALSKRKSASHLFRVTKREGPGKKVASGKVRLEGREVVLTCDTEISALARKFKYYLSENGMAFKVRVLDKHGTLIDTDLEKATVDEDEEAAPPPQAQMAEEAPSEEQAPPAVDQVEPEEQLPPEPEENAETAALRAEYEKLGPLLARVMSGKDQNAAKAIDQLGEVFQGHLNQVEHDRAAKTLKVLKKKLVVALRSVSADEGSAESAA